MRKLTIISVLLVCTFGNLMAKDIIPYATIGIRIGWDFKCGLSISPRLSVGLTETTEGAFINLSYGSRKFQKAFFGNGEFAYLDVQSGMVFKKMPGIFFGGGIGLLFGKAEGETKVFPRTTFFSGCFLFPSIDVTFWNVSNISFDAGVEAVLPIPLGRIDFGSIGGN